MLALAPAASAGSAAGSVTIHSDAHQGTPSRDVVYAVSGSVLTATAMMAQLGPAVATPATRNTSTRYVGATITSAVRPLLTTPCGDESDPSRISSWVSGASQPKAAMSLELEFDLLRGRGKAQFGVADTPNVYARSKFFAPGFVTHTRTSNCLGNEQTEITALPVFSHSEDSMFREDIGWWMLAHTWPVVRTTSGAWRIVGSIHLDADGFEPPHTASLNVTVAGTPVSLNADCRLPTTSDLKRARTTTAAKRITARAGFPRVIIGSRRTAAVPKGRWFIAERVGNGNPRVCGTRLHLLRSRGR